MVATTRWALRRTAATCGVVSTTIDSLRVLASALLRTIEQRQRLGGRGGAAAAGDAAETGFLEAHAPAVLATVEGGRQANAEPGGGDRRLVPARALACATAPRPTAAPYPETAHASAAMPPSARTAATPRRARRARRRRRASSITPCSGPTSPRSGARYGGGAPSRARSSSSDGIAQRSPWMIVTSSSG